MRRELRKQPRDRRDRGRVAIGRQHLEPPGQEVRQVPARATAGVENAATLIEPPPEQLVEQIDVDVAEAFSQVV